MSSSGPSTFIEESDAISPTWLNGPVGQAVRLAMSIQYDALASAAEGAIYAGLPGVAPADALPWAAQDRQIDPGPNESTAHLEGRLSQWLIRSQFYGTPTGVLLAILGYLDPLYPTVITVSSTNPNTINASIWNVYSTGTDPFPVTQSLPSPPQRTVVQNSNWNWDHNSDPFYGVPAWWRAWVIIQSLGGSPWSTYTATFGSSCKFGDGTALGWAGSQNDRQSLQTLTRKWKAAHVTIPSIIVSYASTLFGLSASFGSSTLPDGRYGHWGKVSTVGLVVGQSFSVMSAGGYARVYEPISFHSATFSTYARVYTPARTIAPASYIDGVP